MSILRSITVIMPRCIKNAECLGIIFVSAVIDKLNVGLRYTILILKMYGIIKLVAIAATINMIGI